MTNLWVIEAISVNFGTKRRYRYLQQDIVQGTWKFPCTFQLNIRQGRWKFPCTLPRYMEISMYHIATLAKPTWKRDFRVRYT